MSKWKKIQLWILIIVCLSVEVLVAIIVPEYLSDMNAKGRIYGFILCLSPPLILLYGRFYQYKPGRKQLEEMIGVKSYKSVDKGVKGAKVLYNKSGLFFTLGSIVWIILVIYILFSNKSCSGSDAAGDIIMETEAVNEEAVHEEAPASSLRQQPRCEDVKGYQCARRDEMPEDYTGIAFICEDGKIQAMGTYKDGKRDGLVRRWYENGQLNYKTNYKDGKEDGRDRFWYDNGQLSDEDNYKDGKLDGLSRSWHRNGQMLWEGNYKGGREVGLWRMWYGNGQLWEKAEYQEGVLISQKCYDINGNEEKCE